MGRRQPDEQADDACVVGRRDRGTRNYKKELKKAGASRRDLGDVTEERSRAGRQGLASP